MRRIRQYPAVVFTAIASALLIAAAAGASTGIPAHDVNGATFTTAVAVHAGAHVTFQGRPETITAVEVYPGGSNVFQVFPHLPSAFNGKNVLFLP